MFEISGTALAILNTSEKWTPVKRAVLSHRIRLDQNEQKPPRIDSYLMERVLEGGATLPAPTQQATNLLRFIGDRVLKTGEPLNDLRGGFRAVIGAPSVRAAEAILFELKRRGLLTGLFIQGANGVAFQDVEPTLAGWERYEREIVGRAAGRIAIIAMKFGDPELDVFVDTVVKVAVAEAGYELERVSDRPRAGVIDQIMRVKIRDAPFVIADLTHDNNGAYWEAGFAEGLGKPVIYLCQTDKWARTKTHFDTAHCETIDWHSDNADQFRERLVAIIRNSMAGRN
jgi:hypothetical protein